MRSRHSRSRFSFRLSPGGNYEAGSAFGSAYGSASITDGWWDNFEAGSASGGGWRNAAETRWAEQADSTGREAADDQGANFAERPDGRNEESGTERVNFIEMMYMVNLADVVVIGDQFGRTVRPSV